jgi:hypothetical protein
MLFDPSTDGFERLLAVGKDAGEKRLVLSRQAEQEMLRFDHRGAKMAGFVSREENHATRHLCVPFKHFLLLT